jgi:hypothetical protein
MNQRISFAIAVLALATSVFTLFTTYKHSENWRNLPQEFQPSKNQSFRQYEIKPDPVAMAISLNLLNRPRP